MSTDTPDSSGIANKQVLDEEGNVDEKIKTIVLKSRQRIDELEEAIFIEAATNPQVQIGYEEQVVMWGTAVKQYVRNVEPLLQSPEIAQSSEYYEEIDLGEIQFIPPDTEQRQYSLVASDRYGETQLKQLLDLPRSADIPEVRTVDITGLKDIIETPPQMAEQWHIITHDPGSVTAREYETIATREAVPKETYELAVRKTNEFLHNAGIGMDVGMPEVDDESEPW